MYITCKSCADFRFVHLDINKNILVNTKYVFLCRSDTCVCMYTYENHHKIWLYIMSVGSWQMLYLRPKQIEHCSMHPASLGALRSRRCRIRDDAPRAVHDSSLQRQSLWCRCFLDERVVDASVEERGLRQILPLGCLEPPWILQGHHHPRKHHASPKKRWIHRRVGSPTENRYRLLQNKGWNGVNAHPLGKTSKMYYCTTAHREAWGSSPFARVLTLSHQIPSKILYRFTVCHQGCFICFTLDGILYLVRWNG